MKLELFLDILGTVTGTIAAITATWALVIALCINQRDVKREQRESEPLFRWEQPNENDVGTIRGRQVSCWFTNEGADVTELGIESESGVEARISTTSDTDNCIGEHGRGKIEISVPNVKVMPKLTFVIKYTTRLGKRSEQKFELQGINHPRRIRRSAPVAIAGP